MPTLAATTLEASTASRHTSPRRLKSRQSTATRATRRAQERRLGLADILSNKRSEEHTSELQSQSNLVCRLLLEKKNTRETPEIRTATTTPPPPHTCTIRQPSPATFSVGESSSRRHPCTRRRRKSYLALARPPPS